MEHLNETADKGNIMDIILAHRYACLDNAQAFFKIFGRPLRHFWDGNILGLDIIKFDLWINPEQEKSCQDILLEKYGDEGVKIINNLLLVEEDTNELGQK